jgi:hypothetical protein
MTGAGVDSVLDEVHQRPFIGVCDVLRCVDYADLKHQNKSPMNVRRSRGKFLRQSATLFNHCRQQRINEGIDDLDVELMQVESIQVGSPFLPQEVEDKTRIMGKCREYSQARMAQSL